MKKIIWMTVAVVCILIVGAAGIIASNSEPARRTSAEKEHETEVAKREHETEEKTEASVEAEEMQQSEDASGEEIKKEEPKPSAEAETEKTESVTEPQVQEEEPEVMEDTKPEENTETQNDSQQTQTSEKKEPKEDIDEVVNRLEEEETAAENNIKFPYEIPGTDLVIQKIEPFDGIFLEDGSDVAVSNVTTMLLENTGYKDIEYAEISIKCGEQKLMFEVSILPGGSSMIVQEKNKAQYKQGTYTECKAEAAEAGDLEMSEKQVKITEKGNDSLEVTNLTNDAITTVRIFYKYYMEDEDVYVGGITYTAKIDELAAGGSKLVTPKHYMDGSSQVVMVRIYE